MEKTALKSVQIIVYTINPVTTSMEPVPTVVKMDIKEISVISVRHFVNVSFYINAHYKHCLFLIKL